jgi:hypothetical protein
VDNCPQRKRQTAHVKTTETGKKGCREMEILDSKDGEVIWDTKLGQWANSSSLFEGSYCLNIQEQTAQKRLFDCEDGDSTILQNDSNYLSQDTASHPEGHSLTLITMRTSQAKPRPKELSPSCHESPGTLQGHYMWHTNWHCERLSSEHFGLPLSVSFHVHSVIHY